MNGSIILVVAWGGLAVIAMAVGLFLRRPWLALGGLGGIVTFMAALLYKIGRTL